MRMLPILTVVLVLEGSVTAGELPPLAPSADDGAPPEVAQDPLRAAVAMARVQAAMVTDDLPELRAALHDAARAGNPFAAYNYAVHVQAGRGGPVDLVEARRWYRVAARAGDANAQWNLALSLHRDLGTPAAKAEAYPWLVRCAEQGDADCLWNLVRIVRKGAGVPADPDAARGWARHLALLRAEDDLPALGKIVSARYELAAWSERGEWGAPVDLADAWCWTLIGNEARHHLHPRQQKALIERAEALSARLTPAQREAGEACARQRYGAPLERAAAIGEVQESGRATAIVVNAATGEVRVVDAPSAGPVEAPADEAPADEDPTRRKARKR